MCGVKAGIPEVAEGRSFFYGEMQAAVVGF